MTDQTAARESADTIARINAIPGAMRHMGWMTSAALMERWLHSGAWTMPDSWKGKGAPDPLQMPASHVDQRIVRMSWAMRHPRVRAAVVELRRSMANGAARAVLRDRLAGRSWGASSRIEFGTSRDAAIQLEKSCQANSLTFGGQLDTMDDLYGGLGRAVLKVALVGEAARDARTGRRTLKVSHAGFYIRDTYEFNGPQYLGRWTDRRVLGKALTVGSMVMDMLTVSDEKPRGHVSNRDFNVYRSMTGHGGDFVIYSDVLWERADLTVDLG